MGRPSKATEWLTPDGLLRVKGWARDGLSDEQIAANMGIVKSTFYDWQSKYSDFADAIKEGKAPVDIEVENALLKSALGYTVTIKKPMKLRTKRQLAGKGTIEEERIEYVTEEVYIPPQTVAQLFWLKNRRSGKWRDKPVPDIVSVVSPVDEITAEIFRIQREQLKAEEADTDE